MPDVQLIAGVDEVGRGCLAGPVVAAAVILPTGHDLVGLADSKKLNPRRREMLAPQIQDVAIAWAVASASIEEIDDINILQASLLAMKRSVEALAVRPGLCMVDGNRLPKLDVAAKAVVGGDGQIESIMAASIIAKVWRDEAMRKAHDRFPAYRFDSNKGYGSAVHMAALAERGPCPLHRMSFAPCAEAAKNAKVTA